MNEECGQILEKYEECKENDCVENESDLSLNDKNLPLKSEILYRISS